VPNDRDQLREEGVMNSIRKTLAQYDIRPRKRLGQSFLEDRNMICRIAALVAPSGGDIVVEIGAGLGVLTEELAKKAGRVIALEIDPRLISVLKDRFAGHDRVEIVAGDVLAYDFTSACQGRRIKVVGNIPYYISTPILFRLIENRRAISSMVLMFQKELADRIMADPGTKDYGIPSVIISRYARATRELTVPPTCFFPEPGVVSSVLSFVIQEDETTREDELQFAVTVRSAFSHRRKTLWNNLRAAGFTSKTLEQVMKKIDIEGSRRAETLTVDQFRLLAMELATGGAVWRNSLTSG
jgi:16S rRNA (adenine1518-N6/adenine1519-N6)-dimethyltransferase